MPEIGRKEFTILRILGERNVPLGAGIIAHELKVHGIELTERAVRYHLQALDDLGLTEGQGRTGRRLTEAGRSELADARVADKVALTFARMESLAYQTAFDLTEGKGKIALNVSLFRRGDFDAAMRVMRPVFRSRYATSDLTAVFDTGQRVADQVVPRGMVGLGTVCSVTINGVLLSHGIPVQSEFGGLLEVSGYEPARFTDIVRYAGTSVDPVEVFIKGRATGIGSAVATGRGKIGAGFRTFPSVARDHVSQLVEQMSSWRIHGVIAVGAASRPLLEVDVGVGRAALVVCAGLNPIGAAEEAGIEATSTAMATVLDYEDLEQV